MQITDGQCRADDLNVTRDVRLDRTLFKLPRTPVVNVPHSEQNLSRYVDLRGEPANS